MESLNINYRKDICCIIFNYAHRQDLLDRYKKLGKVACDSFKKHHPDIKLFYIEKDDIKKMSENLQNMHVGLLRYAACYEICKKNNFSRCIILGADTITCSYLDDFIDDTEHDILCSLDYPYPLVSANFVSPPGDTHVNADVNCFNNIEALVDIIKISAKHAPYFEQGGLNEIIWKEKKYKFKIVDAPYEASKVVYNARAKGNIAAGPGQKPWGPYIQKFYVNDNKLFTHDNKQIKVFHFCEGFGGLQEREFANLLNRWILEWFNSDTKLFFKQNCGTGDFFDKKYEI